MEPVIRDISDTARWVAVFRAEESERPDAVFHDPYARRLAGDRGKQIAEAIEFSREHSWSFVARTHLFDAAVNRHVAEGFGIVLRSPSQAPSTGLLGALTRDDPRGVEEILSRTGRSVQQVLAELMTLEMEDKVRRLPGALYVRN